MHFKANFSLFPMVPAASLYDYQFFRSFFYLGNRLSQRLAAGTVGKRRKNYARYVKIKPIDRLVSEIRTIKVWRMNMMNMMNMMKMMKMIILCIFSQKFNSFESFCFKRRASPISLYNLTKKAPRPSLEAKTFETIEFLGNFGYF